MIGKKVVRREPQTPAVFGDGVHPVLGRVYAGRNVSGMDEVDYSLGNLLPYNLLSHIGEATRLLVSGLEEQKHIVIVADYDADGATACALGLRGLKALGAARVDFIVPDRFEHGYGLSPAIVELAAELEPDLLITVDNGISSMDGVARARELGMEVLITDHHLPGPQLPDASVIVNPNLAGDAFPSKALAGVGVMFYVLAALRAGLRDRDWFDSQGIPEPNLASLLDLVALGTVADVVPLDGNNRTLVAQGLRRIREGHCIAGISALLTVAGREPRSIVSSDLGFILGPRLNAAGRLSDMSLGIRCLLCDDGSEALHMAAQLDQLNQDRKKIQAGMESEAIAALDAIDLQSLGDLPAGICLYQQDWHQGVIGVLASKIRERTHRPVIAFARESENILKGSARSIRDIHIRDVLEAITNRNPDIIINYGGHAMAAGLSLRQESFEIFSELFDREVDRHLKNCGLDSELVSDGELEAGDFSLELAELLRAAGPWGQGFPEPQFDGVFQVSESRIVGGNHLKLQLALQNGAKPVEAIAFNTTDEQWPGGYEQVHALYRLDINEFRGRRILQLVIEHIEPRTSAGQGQQ